MCPVTNRRPGVTCFITAKKTKVAPLQIPSSKSFENPMFCQAIQFFYPCLWWSCFVWQNVFATTILCNSALAWFDMDSDVTFLALHCASQITWYVLFLHSEGLPKNCRSAPFANPLLWVVRKLNGHTKRKKTWCATKCFLALNHLTKCPTMSHHLFVSKGCEKFRTDDQKLKSCWSRFYEKASRIGQTCKSTSTKGLVGISTRSSKNGIISTVCPMYDRWLLSQWLPLKDV